ncbi:MAG: VCBS repeat-containing protein [Methylococcaceae bacterium]|nr:VCBS repeat-containing protein [Methylococcaceae bacterium]
MADSEFNAAFVINPFGFQSTPYAQSPTFADIDGDGDLDAFIGNYDGKTQFYRNNGTATKPNFVKQANNFGLIDVGRYSSPSFVDIDDDGDLDAFVGNSSGQTLFFRNTGTISKPSFTAENNNFGIETFSRDVTVDFADIDGDGDQDAFVSSFNVIRSYQNTGTSTTPHFVLDPNNFGISLPKDFFKFTLVDIDNDGDTDAITVNLNGHIDLIRNTGTKTAPNFVLGPFNEDDLAINGGFINRISFADIDGDKDLDLFVGDEFGQITFNLGNAQPTLTAFNGPVASGEEDPKTPLKITFEQLLSQSDAVDSDGVITGFSIFSKIGSPIKIYDSITNQISTSNVIDATHYALWTPPVNVNGLVDAFSIAAVDNEGGRSAYLDNFVIGQVNLAPTNDAPIFFGVSWLYIDTPFDDVFAPWRDKLSASDIDGDKLTFGIVDGIDNGNGTVSKVDQYGVLTVNKSTGAFSLLPNDLAIESLTDIASFGFTVTVSDGSITVSQPFGVTIFQEGDIFTEFDTETNGDDTLIGTSGDDRFIGLAGNDVINGLQGNDVLIGDLGNDVLDGGADRDWASYSTATGPVSVNLGIVGPQDTENAGLDTLISIENLIGSNFDDILIGNDSDNVLIGGLGNDILIGGGGIDTASFSTSKAAVQVSLAITSQQNTIAAGVDTLRNIENLIGSRFNDTLAGNAGANSLIGGLGNDNLDGKDGSDTASYRTATAGVTVNLATTGQQNTVNAGLDTLSNIENLEGSHFDDILNGNASDNSLIGGLGNDILEGDQGNDFLDGGLGIDAASYVSSSAGVTVNLGIAGQQNTFGAGVDTLKNIENLIGSHLNDTLIGTSAANSLIGGLGDDVLINGTASYITSDTGVRVNLSLSVKQNTIGAGFDMLAGITAVMGSNFNDTLIGSSQESVLIGGLGNDTLVRGTASYISATAGVSVNLSISGQQNTISAGFDTLININNLIGSDFNDNLIGNSGNNVFIGGAGNDFINGGEGNDWISFTNLVNSVSVALGDFGGSAFSSTTGNDSLVNIENIIGSDFGDFLTGNSKSNNFIGGKGNDQINGRDGNDTADYSTAKTGVKVNLGIETQQNTLGAGLDTLISIENIKGSDFNDSLNGNTLTNLFVGGLGDDVIDGKEGRDTASFYSAKTGVNVNLGITGQQNTEGAGKDTLISIENLVGSQFNDTLIGNAERNVIEGNLGNDFIDGGDGIDWASYRSALAGVTVNLGVLNQQNTVNAGLDTLKNIENLIGSQYDDTLTGNAASNVFIGGLGNDLINGGDGIDTASYITATTGVTVDLSKAVQQNTISAGLDTLSNIENLIGSDFNDTLIGNNNDNVFIGGLGRDKVLGGGGFDTLSYSRSENSILVFLNQGLISVNKSGDFDSLTSIENIVGTDFNDRFIMNNTDDNVINGGDGFDTISFDDIFPETGLVGVTINLSITGKQNTISAGFDTFINIENLIGTSVHDNLTGNSKDNLLVGGTGINILNGAGGIDTVSYAGFSFSPDEIGITVNLGIDGPQDIQNFARDTLISIENLIGGDGQDTLIGNNQANVIQGVFGSDEIIGKAGNDLLTGGGGNDIFVFDNAVNADTNNDIINDFGSLVDKIRLDNSIFTQLTSTGTLSAENFVSRADAKALDSNDYLLYDTDNGSLYYDADGNGAGAKIEFVSLTGIPSLTAGDIVIV